MTPDPTVVDDQALPSLDDAVPTAEDAAASGPASNLGAGAARPEAGNLLVLFAFAAAMVAIGAFVSWWIPGLIAGLLGVLFLHELGHYASARWSGMKVTEFFLGFGPRIWSIRRGETEYGLKAIPAGAYVRIIGMTNLDEVDPADEHLTYRAQPYWQRMVTICAGSAMHFAMALVALVVLFASYQYPGFHGPPWQVDRVVPGSSAEALGIEPGDVITRFEGQTFNTWEEFGALVQATPVGPIELEIERDDGTLRLGGELGPRSGDVVGAGFGLLIEEGAESVWEVDSLLTGGGAERFGLETGDRLLSAGGVEQPSQFDLAAALSAHDGRAFEVLVERNGRPLTLSGNVALEHTDDFRGFLGVGADWAEPGDPSWPTSIRLAIADFGTIAATNIGGLVDMLNPMTWIGDETPEPVGGFGAAPGAAPLAPPDDGGARPVSIIGIFRLIAESESVDQVLYLFMMVNVFIGVFNLAPLLPLDGGHAALATYERGRQLVGRNPEYRVDASKLLPVVWAVVILLVGVGLWAAALDIFSWPG